MESHWNRNSDSDMMNGFGKTKNGLDHLVAGNLLLFKYFVVTSEAHTQ